MGIYDIAMLIVFAGAIWFGYWKGLLWQVASLAAIIVSYIVAVNFRDPVAGFIQAEAPWDRIGAMLILFIATSLLIWSIYASVSKSLKKAELKGFDRQAGAMLGAVKGSLLCMVITMFSVSLLGERAHNAIDNSKLGPYVEKGIWQVSAIVPAELAKYVDPHIKSYQEASGHGEPEVDLGLDFQNMATSSYPVNEQPLNQNANQLPPTGAQTGYPGRWQTNTESSSNQLPNNQSNQQNSPFGIQYGGAQTQSGWNQTGGFGTSTNQEPPSEFDISTEARKLLEQAKQQGINLGMEAARAYVEQNLKNGGQQR